MRFYRFGEEVVGVTGASPVAENAGRVMNPEQAYTVAREQVQGGTSPVVESVVSPSQVKAGNGPNWLLWGAVAVGAYWFWKKK